MMGQREKHTHKKELIADKMTRRIIVTGVAQHSQMGYALEAFVFFGFLSDETENF